MPRPTPRQRSVLEAMSDGTALRIDRGRWFLDSGQQIVIRGNVVTGLRRQRWIQAEAPDVYVITEAGRRAVARDNGGV